MPFSFNINLGKPKDNEAKSKNRPISWFGFIRYIYPITIVIIVAILIGFMGFLHNNVYLTMARAEIISNLKNTVTDEILDSQKFSDALAKMETKRSLAIWPNAGKLTSPFNYGKRSTSTAATTSPSILIVSSTLKSLTPSSSATTKNSTSSKNSKK